MSTYKFTIKSITIPFFIGLAAILMGSCGTQHQAYNQNDGIYDTGGDRSQRASNENNTRANYYQQYFQTKSMSYEDAQTEEDVIFTDIDAYATTERLDDDGNIIIEENHYEEDGYGPWGTNANNTVVNIYNYGNYGFWRPPYYGYGYGGYWGSYYGWGYYGPFWRMNFGWGYPYHYGYNYGYYYPSYYNPPYIANNRGRRNTDYNRSGVRGRTNNATSRNNASYSRSESSRRVNRNNVRANTTTGRNNTVRQNQSTRNVRSSSNTRNVRSNSNTRNVRSTPNTGNVRSSSNTRNVRSTPNRSNSRMSTPRSTNRSSGGIRSSGGSRSSGSVRSSGGRSSGGRGRG